MTPEEKVAQYNYLIMSVVPSLKNWVEQDEKDYLNLKMGDATKSLLNSRILDNKYLIKAIEGK